MVIDALVVIVGSRGNAAALDCIIGFGINPTIMTMMSIPRFTRIAIRFNSLNAIASAVPRNVRKPPIASSAVKMKNANMRSIA